MSLRVSVNADVADAGSGDQFLDAVDHAETGAEDGNQGDLFIGEDFEGVRSYRGLDDLINKREVFRDLVDHQGGDLTYEFAEILGGCVFVAHK